LILFLLASGGVNLIFGTELFETGELTLSVIILFLEIVVFRCEIRFLIRLGYFCHRVGLDDANSLLCELLLDATNKVAVVFKLSEIFLATSG
jgi:hypothetical protein